MKMQTQPDPHYRRDLLKLSFLIFAILGTIAVFLVSPNLSIPVILSILASTLLSPWIAALERQGLSRTVAISLTFLAIFILAITVGYFMIQSGIHQWKQFKDHAPNPFHQALQQAQIFELTLKARHPIFSTLQITENLLALVRETETWFSERGPSLMGTILSWFIVVPVLSFVLLDEVRTIRTAYFKLVPNRYFESSFLIATDIVSSISDYLRAKLIEGAIVGFLVSVGLAIIGAPYPIIFGIAAGATNIIPYLGPIVGAIPGILVIAFDPTLNHLTLAAVMVYMIANIIDAAVLFPLIVAKLVRLHPIVLVAAVAIGQKYYGLIGMLISVPVATAMKVIIQEIYTSIYQQGDPRQQMTSENFNFRVLK